MLCFQSSFSTAWYLEEVLDRFLEDALVICLACFGVLFCRLVLCCRYTPLTTGPSSQWCQFFNLGVFECDFAHRRSVAVLCMLYKIMGNPMHPVLFLCRLCRCGLHVVLCNPVHLCASSLQNLAVSPDFYSFVSISVERS